MLDKIIISVVLVLLIGFFILSLVCCVLCIRDHSPVFMQWIVNMFLSVLGMIRPIMFLIEE